MVLLLVTQIILSTQVSTSLTHLSQEASTEAFPGNKITAIAGESSTGKTFFCLGMVQHFLESNPDAGVIYFESESALSKDMIEDSGIDSSRMMIVPVTTVQEFRTQSIKY